MSTQLTNPLQSLLKKAASTLPVTSGKVAAAQARLDRRQGQVVILVDVSASMNGPAWGTQRKIDVLREAVAMCQRQRSAAGRCRLIAFSGSAQEVHEVPEPDWNTNLEEGLRAAQALDPGVTLVISDGLPDNEAAALAVARTFRGAIDVLYIGPEQEKRAIEFMRRLAAAAAGTVTINDIGSAAGARELTTRLTALLPPG